MILNVKGKLGHTLISSYYRVKLVSKLAILFLVYPTIHLSLRVCVHISFNSKLSTIYELHNCSINSQPSLDIIICADLQWYHHHEYVFGRAYKMFDIIWCIFSQSNSVTSYAKIKLYSYTSLTYQITAHLYRSIGYWQLHLITSSTKGNHANSYLLNNILPIIIISKVTLFNEFFEISDIMLGI